MSWVRLFDSFKCIAVPLRPVCLCSLFALLTFLCGAALAAGGSPDWRKVHSDMEVAQVGIASNDIFTPELALVRTSLKSFRLEVLRASDFGYKRSDAKTLCSESKATLCINANFFDEDGKALGLVVSRGIMHQKIHAGGALLNGILQASRRRVSVVDRRQFDRSSVVEAVQAGPRLIENGLAIKNLPNNTNKSRRAGACVDKQGRLIFFCSSSSLGGLTIERLQTVLLSKGIECHEALNLDGGGSAQMFLGQVSGVKRSPEQDQDRPIFDLPGGDEVPVVLALILNGQ